MPINRIKIYYLFFLGLMTVHQAWAQPRPEPGTGKVPAQIEPGTPGEPSIEPEDASKGKKAHLRVWNFSGRSTKEALGVFAKSQKAAAETEVAWLSRAIPYGTVGNYVDLEPGKYRFFIVSDPAATFDGEKPVNPNLSPKAGTENLVIDLADKDYLTLVIEDDQGRLKTSLLKDSELPMEGFTYRAINMTDLADASVVEIKAGVAETVFAQLSPGQWVNKANPTARRTSLEARYKNDKGFPLKQYIEIEPENTRSVSLILFYDRYDRPTFRSFPDAPKS